LEFIAFVSLFKAMPPIPFSTPSMKPLRALHGILWKKEAAQHDQIFPKFNLVGCENPTVTAGTTHTVVKGVTAVVSNEDDKRSPTGGANNPTDMVSESLLRIESITDDGSSPVDLAINSTASSAARPMTATKLDLRKARFEYEQVMGVSVGKEPLLPYSSDELLVRDCYSEMYDVLVEDERTRIGERKCAKTADGEYCYVSDRSCRRNRDKVRIISGQPGIGKTWFLSYLLVRRLLGGKPTILQVSERLEGSADLCEAVHYLLDDHGVRQMDAEMFESMASNTEIWVLADQKAVGHPRYFRHHQWLVIITSSPNEENFKYLKKDYCPKEFFFPVWTWQEVVAGW
jgi:hypothetical protein